MLSPSIRQVFHALLTRPPLTYNSLGFVISPFDLHVLGTPPAFILSQDQTLIIKFISSTSINWLISVYFLFKGFCSLNNSIQYFSSKYLFLLEFSGLHYCLFVKVLSSKFLTVIFVVRDSFNIIARLVAFCQHLFLIFFKKFVTAQYLNQTVTNMLSFTKPARPFGHYSNIYHSSLCYLALSKFCKCLKPFSIINC